MWSSTASARSDYNLETFEKTIADLDVKLKKAMTRGQKFYDYPHPDANIWVEGESIPAEILIKWFKNFGLKVSDAGAHLRLSGWVD
jgi:hypothetical protein